MQSMPYYQSGYQAPTSYSNNGSPVPASVMNTGAPPPMMPPTMSHPPIPEAANAAPPPQQPPKRKQVKNACTNCQKACKKCDDARPCPRCIKYGIADTCVNSVRKERKKGIKRGPYKRRQKDGSSSTSRKGDEQLVNQQAAANPYAAMRPGTMPFGYPGTLNQYGQPTYDPYGSYAATAYHKDMPYVVNPMYSSMGYPVMMSGSSSDANQQHHQGQQQQHPSAGQQQQQQQQQSPVPTQYTMMHPQASRYGEHVLHSPQSQSPTAAHMYYQQQQPPHQQQQQHQQSRLSPQLPEIKHDPHQQQQHDSSHQYMKPQPMTPVPSASNSSITSTPPPHADSTAAGGVAPTTAPGGGEDESKYERLSQLCSAALHSDSSQQNHSPQPSQQ